MNKVVYLVNFHLTWHIKLIHPSPVIHIITYTFSHVKSLQNTGMPSYYNEKWRKMGTPLKTIERYALHTVLTCCSRKACYKFFTERWDMTKVIWKIENLSWKEWNFPFLIRTHGIHTNMLGGQSKLYLIFLLVFLLFRILQLNPKPWLILHIKHR